MYISIFIWKAYKHISSYPTSPASFLSSVSAMAGPGAWKFICVFNMGRRDPVTWTITCYCLPGYASSRSWISISVARTSTRHSDMKCGFFKWWLNHCTKSLPLEKNILPTLKNGSYYFRTPKYRHLLCFLYTFPVFSF